MSSRSKPKEFPVGIEYVIVNGKVVVDGNVQNQTRAGRALRRGRLTTWRVIRLMADPNPPACGERGPAAEDTKAERTVLAFLLEEHPSHLTIRELALALNVAHDSFTADDTVARAVRQLVGAGLLHCQGTFVVPTRAALYVERLALLA